MKNIEKYYDEIKQRLKTTDVDNLFCTVNEFRTGCDDCTMLSNCRNCCMKNLEWLNQDYKEKILDDVEREYLSSVIKPFRKNVLYIFKQEKGYEHDVCFIDIVLKGSERIHLPYFNAESGMYAGMQPFVKYSLEELGL